MYLRHKYPVERNIVTTSGRLKFIFSEKNQKAFVFASKTVKKGDDDSRNLIYSYVMEN